VAARCAHARAGVGAAASQNITDPTLGHRLLDLLAQGCSATAALAELQRSEALLEFRQLTVVDRMGEVADRIVQAMKAGRDAGGEAGPVHSSGMLMVDRVAWPVADLRVDWTDGDPIAELNELWRMWQPQLEAYVTRALDPASAPAYGVAGDQ
ncbi:MAG: DUF1028 domain-containing protein, partial [Casimicrobiaceae bacterium]